MTMQVTAWELEYHDNYANSHKYYRVYVLPDSYMVQWGRIGATGQFKVTPSNQPDYDANNQTYAKLNKGYDYSSQRLVLQVDEPWVRPTTRTQQLTLDRLFNVTKSNLATVGATVPVIKADDFMARQQTKQQAEEDRLKATLLRIAGRAEPDEAEPIATPDNNTMEAKLAAAMTKAKEARA